MGKEIADISDMREKAFHEHIVASLANRDSLESCVFDRTKFLVKLVNRLAIGYSKVV